MERVHTTFIESRKRTNTIEELLLENLDKEKENKTDTNMVNKTIHYGDEGVVESVDRVDLFNETQIWVKFDKGSHLALIEGIDQYEVIEKN